MLPVLSPAALREVDAWTIEHEPIASHALMERAAANCTKRLLELVRSGSLGEVRTILTVCGMGNNGGDGLTMARLLHHAGWSVSVVRIGYKESATQDNERNKELLESEGISVLEVRHDEQFPRGTADLLIDALVGTGVTTPLSGLALAAVRWMNAMDGPKVAIDLPSGLFAESNSGNDYTAIVRAARTLTLEVPKLSLLLPENGEFTGQWEVVPIGLSAGYVKNCPTRYGVMERDDVRDSVRYRPPFGNKGTFGHVMLIGGSLGRMGAMVMSTNAALRSGAGLVTAVVPDEGIPVMQACAPEAMCHPGCGQNVLSALPAIEGYSVIGIGPGLSIQEGPAGLVETVLRQFNGPLVIDADALNIISDRPGLLDFLPPDTVLTPHPKEFDRLAGKSFESGYDRLQQALQSAQDWRCHIVLKGAYTAVCAPDGTVRFNATGNAGMAKGGSGDALTGLLAGLLAQGYRMGDACAIAVYLHGLAGDIAAKDLSQEGMTAMDLVRALPRAWLALKES